MLRLTVAGICAALWAIPAAAQGTFEGVVTYNMQTQEGKNGTLRYYESGGRTRQEFATGAQMMASITDHATGDMTLLLPARKQYMVINLKSAMGPMAQMAQGMAGGPGAGGRKAPDLSKLRVTATGHETVAGVECDDYHFAGTDPSDHQTVDVCGAKGMGFLGQGYMMPSTATLLGSGHPELASLAHDGFFPLKVKVTNGDRVTTLEATAVSRDKPDASLFAPPADYSKLSLPGMTGGNP